MYNSFYKKKLCVLILTIFFNHIIYSINLLILHHGINILRMLMYAIIIASSFYFRFLISHIFLFFTKTLVRVCFGLSCLTLNECFPRQTVVLSLNLTYRELNWLLMRRFCGKIGKESNNDTDTESKKFRF